MTVTLRDGKYIVTNIYHTYWMQQGQIGETFDGSLIFIPDDKNYTCVPIAESAVSLLL